MKAKQKNLNKILHKNLKAIKSVSDNYINWLDNQPHSIEWCEEIRALNGSKNFIYKDGNKKLNAYNMNSPFREAKTAANGMNLYKENVSVLIGIGLGYLVKAILQKMEKGHRIIVIEPIGEMVRKALSNFDFSSAIRNGNLIIVSQGEDEIAFTLQTFENQSVVEDWVITTEGYAIARTLEYTKQANITSEIINQIRCNTGTISGAAGGKIANNDIECLPYVIRYRGVNELKDLFKGKPCICVGTGPSLAKNIHNLIQNQDKVIIIAVGQALRVLLAYSIIPDFICSVDFGEVNYGHFKGLMNSGVPLVTINRTYAPLLRDWQGPKFICGTPVPGYEKTAAGILSEKGFIEAGGSVAHLNFGLAQLLGCNPITFMGQDLALGKTSHIPLADAAGEVSVSDDGFIMWDVKDQRCTLHGDVKHSMGVMHKVPGFYGDMVLTNLGLASFLTVFENMIARHKNDSEENLVFNCTEGGAEIKGAQGKAIIDYIDEFCCEKIDKSSLQPLLTYADDDQKLIEEVIPRIKEDMKVLRNIVMNARKGIYITKKIREFVNDDRYENILSKKKERLLDNLMRETHRETKGEYLQANLIYYYKLMKELPRGDLKNIVELSLRNFEYSSAAQRSSTLNPLINVAIYGASRKIQGRQMKADETLTNFLKNKEDALIRMERNEFILKTAKTESEKLLGNYKKTRKILEEYQKTKDDSLLKPEVEEKLDLSDVEEYLENGNWANPLVSMRLNGFVESKNLKLLIKLQEMSDDAIREAQKKQEKNIDQERILLKYNRMIHDSKEVGRKYDFEKSLEYLEQAIEIMPDEIDARWGYATVLHHCGFFEKSSEVYKKLVEDFPDHHRFKFELGHVYFKLGKVQEGLDAITDCFAKTDEFDSSIGNIGNIYLKAKVYDKALASYEIHLKKFPYDIDIMKNYAECLAVMGEEKKSKKIKNDIKKMTS